MSVPTGKLKLGSGPRSPESATSERLETSNERGEWIPSVNHFTHADATGEIHDQDDVRPYGRVKLYGREFQALLDTGSSVDLVGKNVMDHLRTKFVQPLLAKTRLRMANGLTCLAEREFHLEGEIANKQFSIRALGVPNLTTDVVLGMPTIIKLGLSALLVPSKNVTLGGTFPETGVNALSLLKDEEKVRLKNFLDEELPLFNNVPGKTHLVEHKIRLKDGVTPIKQRYYPRNPAMTAIIHQEIETMLKDGVIEPSTSGWSSPIVLSEKSSGKYRFCVTCGQ